MSYFEKWHNQLLYERMRKFSLLTGRFVDNATIMVVKLQHRLLVKRQQSNPGDLLNMFSGWTHRLKLKFTWSHMTIYVGNLSYQASEADLKAVFADYGEVKRVVLPTDRETGRMRGFAFVEMTEDAQEDAAITELDGAEWMGRQLRVNKAKPREENQRSSWGKKQDY